MLKKLFAVTALLAALFAAPNALAQSQPVPPFYYSFVPTAGQWNSFFTAKMDYLGGPANAIPYYTGSGTTYGTVSGDCTEIAMGFTCKTLNGVAPGNLFPLNAGTGLSIAGGVLNVTGAPPTGAAGGVLSGTYPNPGFASATGTGAVVLATSPTLTTPNLGTPSAINLSNGTNLPLGSITGLGTGVATALGTALNASGGVAPVTSPTFGGTVTLPSGATATTAGLSSVVALGVGETAPASGNVNISGQYQVAGSQIAALNLSNGITGTGAVVLANAPTFTGAFALPNGSTATTQTGGDNTTKVATDAFVQNALGSNAVVRSYIAGLALSTAGSSATFSVAAGIAADSTNVSMMNLASVMSKTTSAWSAGNNGGCLDTGTIAASTWYAIFEIDNIAGPTIDVVCTKETAGTPPSPTLPSGYTLKRYIGSMVTDGSSHWYQFVQDGHTFYLIPQPQDFAAVCASASRTLMTLSTPVGVKTRPIFRAKTQTTVADAFIFTSPDQADVAPVGVGTSGAPGADLMAVNAVNLDFATTRVADLYTNLSSQIGCRSNSGNAIYETTAGWIDDLGAYN